MNEIIEIFDTELGELTIEQIGYFFIFVAIVGGIASCIVYFVAKWHLDNKDDKQPERSCNATIIDLPSLRDAVNIWVMFQTEDGERVRLLCESNVTYLQGDKGYLKWQGNRLIKFIPGKTKEEIISEKKTIDHSRQWECKHCGEINMNSWDKCVSCNRNRMQ